MAIGDRRKFLTALIVPQFARLEEHARAHGIPFSSRTDLLRRPEIHELFRMRIEAHSSDLAPYERIKDFTLLDHELVEGDLLTPTQKIKRKAFASRYADLIEDMYRPSRPSP